MPADFPDKNYKKYEGIILDYQRLEKALENLFTDYLMLFFLDKPNLI